MPTGVVLELLSVRYHLKLLLVNRGNEQGKGNAMLLGEGDDVLEVSKCAT